MGELTVVAAVKNSKGVTTVYRSTCFNMQGGHRLFLASVSILVIITLIACIAALNRTNPSTLDDETPQAAARRFLFSHSHSATQEAWLAKKRNSLMEAPYSSVTRKQLIDRSQFSSAHMTNILSSGGDNTVTDETSNVGSAMRLALDSSLKRDMNNKYTQESSNMAKTLALVRKIPLSLPHDILADPDSGVATIPAVRPIL